MRRASAGPGGAAAASRRKATRLSRSGAAIAAAAILLAAPAAEAHPLDVVTSFTVLADMVRQIGGRDVRVHSLVGPGSDSPSADSPSADPPSADPRVDQPHVDMPNRRDAAAIAGARLIVVGGLGLDGWVAHAVAAVGGKGTLVVASRGIDGRRMSANGREVTDPYAWNSAADAMIYAQNITAALIKADPADTGDLAARGVAYEQRLQDLDTWAHLRVSLVPAQRRRVIVARDGFGYLGAAYNIEILAPAATQPTAAALIAQIRRDRVTAIFLGNTVDRQLAGAITKATGARIGGRLYPDALSGPNGPAPTYTRMFRYNITTLVDAMRAPITRKQPSG
jgi:zinc/manganese transport system substrate-binding protein